MTGDCPAIALRPAEPADGPAVSALLRRSYTTLFAGWYAPDLLAAVLPDMTRAQPALLAGSRYHLAFLDGILAACGGWSLEVPGCRSAPVPGLAHIRHFATDPDLVRRGAAGAILAQCLSDARKEGVRAFSCVSSLPAEPFYRASGFVAERQGTVRFPCGRDFPSVFMRLDFGDPISPDPTSLRSALHGPPCQG